MVQSWIISKDAVSLRFEDMLDDAVKHRIGFHYLYWFTWEPYNLLDQDCWEGMWSEKFIQR